MKLLIAAILVILGLSFTSAFAVNSRSSEGSDSRNIIFITQLYKEFFEKKDFDQMNKYFSKDVVFYKDSEGPVGYAVLRKHLLEQGKQCIQLNMLPFDHALVSGNKVVILYTQNCTDKFSKIHKKRIMAIIEVDHLQKVSKILAVTHEEK